MLITQTLPYLTPIGNAKQRQRGLKSTGLGGKMGTGTICRNGPEGASHKWCLSPFSR
jgi:hypothetical protein